MDLSFIIILLAVPLVTFVISQKFLKHSVSLLEGALSVVIIGGIVAGAWSINRFDAAIDYEIWNGEITEMRSPQRYCQVGWKRSMDSFCEHYTTRQVKTGETCEKNKTTGKRECTATYATEYNYDYWWERKFYIKSSVGDEVRIATDPQGATIPKAYSDLKVGDPASTKNKYMNWMRAASENLFAQDGQAEEKYEKVLPAYPEELYDYFKINRVVQVDGAHVPSDVNGKLSDILKTLGPKKQMNIVLVVYNTTNIGNDFPPAVRRYWRGFKKNDAVLFLGVDGENKLDYVESISWSKSSAYDITIRDKVYEMKGKVVDYDVLLKNIVDTSEVYERRSMKEFEYLKSQIPVSWGLIISTFVIGLLASLGVTFVFTKINL